MKQSPHTPSKFITIPNDYKQKTNYDWSERQA